MERRIATLPAALALLASAAPGSAATQEPSGRLAVVAGELWTMAEDASDPIENGVVLIDEGRVTAVGPSAEVAVPDGWPVREVAVATPGLVDPHTSVGLAGWLNAEHVNDELDTSEAVQPELRAIDAYDLDDPLVEWVRSYGVTTVHTGPAPGTLVPGRTMLAKTAGRTVLDAVLVEDAMLSAVLADSGRGTPESGPGTRAKSAALLREALVSGAEYAEKEDEGDRDLRKEVLASVVSGELPLLVTAHAAHDLETALRLAEEFGDVRLVLDGAAEARRVLDEILAAGVPVVLHPTMMRAGGDAEDLSFVSARELDAAGVPLAIQSGYESYVPRARVLLFETAIAARYGLPRERALALVTIEAARICGVADRVGSLEVGKHGDLALFDGDPFEYTTHCVGTVIEGELASDGELWETR